MAKPFDIATPSSMAKKSILFVINPISGTANKEKIEREIAQNIDQSRFDANIRYTEYAGHAAELASEAAQQNIDIVVAVGGDGTINEVARSLVHTNTALGIVPCGSGNGLARHLHLPLDPQQAIAVINEAVVHTLDYGRINNQPFFCTCGVGFDAFISHKFAEAGTRGIRTYMEKTLIDGLSYKPETYRLTIGRDANDSQHLDAFLIAAANASQYGNNAYIAPHASMKDGLLDVTILEPFNLIEGPQILYQLFNKSIVNNSHVKTFRTDYLRIERSTPGVAHCDGDPFETEMVLEVELIPRSFHVVVNDKYRRQATANADQNFLRTVFDTLHIIEPIEEITQKTTHEIKRLNATILERLRKL